MKTQADIDAEKKKKNSDNDDKEIEDTLACPILEDRPLHHIRNKLGFYKINITTYFENYHVTFESTKKFIHKIKMV